MPTPDTGATDPCSLRPLPWLAAACLASALLLYLGARGIGTLKIGAGMLIVRPPTMGGSTGLAGGSGLTAGGGCAPVGGGGKAGRAGGGGTMRPCAVLCPAARGSLDTVRDLLLLSLRSLDDERPLDFERLLLPDIFLCSQLLCLQ